MGSSGNGGGQFPWLGTFNLASLEAHLSWQLEPHKECVAILECVTAHKIKWMGKWTQKDCSSTILFKGHFSQVQFFPFHFQEDSYFPQKKCGFQETSVRLKIDLTNVSPLKLSSFLLSEVNLNL